MGPERASCFPGAQCQALSRSFADADGLRSPPPGDASALRYGRYLLATARRFPPAWSWPAESAFRPLAPPHPEAPPEALRLVEDLREALAIPLRPPRAAVQVACTEEDGWVARAQVGSGHAYLRGADFAHRSPRPGEDEPVEPDGAAVIREAVRTLLRLPEGVLPGVDAVQRHGGTAPVWTGEVDGASLRPGAMVLLAAVGAGWSVFRQVYAVHLPLTAATMAARLQANYWRCVCGARVGRELAECWSCGAPGVAG